MPDTRVIRSLLMLEAAAFLVAASTHFGLLVDGYQHAKAGTAESVIGLVLAVCAVMTWARPDAVRSIGLMAQGFALFGTCVGLISIGLGVGPRTVPDLVFHLSVVTVLIVGLTMTAASRRSAV